MLALLATLAVADPLAHCDSEGVRVVYVGHKFVSAWAIVGPEHTVIVDTGWPKGEDRIRKQLDKAGVDPQSVSIVVVTHGHGDHLGSAAALQAELAARDEQRLAAWTGHLDSMAASLREQWEQAGSHSASRQQEICDTLAQTARDITAQAEAHASSTIAEVARLMVDAGLIVLVAFISPFRAERRMARGLFSHGEFLEVFVDTSLEVAEHRDPKGLYKRARKGEIPEFTGISSPYEAPDRPDLVVATDEQPVDECLARLIRYVEGRFQA